MCQSRLSSTIDYMLRITPSRSLLVLSAIAAAAIATGCGEDPPRPALTVTPGSQVLTGQDVTIRDAEPTTDGADLVSSWDLDGDGRFEIRPSFANEMTTRYSTPGTRDVSIDVYKDIGLWGATFPIHGYATTPITVSSPPQSSGTPQPGPTQPAANQPPTADFSTDADPAYSERPVDFDGSASKDPDGQIVKYEWDWESDGTYDATGATATHAYTFAGTYEATLRVTDNSGATATTQRAISVVDGVPPGESLGSGEVSAARAGTPFSTVPSGKLVKPGESFINGGTLFQAGLSARGSMKLTKLPAPLQHKRSAKWAGAFVIKQHGSTATSPFSVEGYLLLDFGHRDRVCFNGRVSGTPSTQFTGPLAVVGGSGVGQHVRGAATITVPVDAKEIKGRLDLRKTRKARTLPKACKSLVRTLR
jgi:PKD repeat protein